MYTINSAMDGSQFIYGVQLGLSYKVNDWLGVFAGVPNSTDGYIRRANYYVTKGQEDQSWFRPHWYRIQAPVDKNPKLCILKPGKDRSCI